MRADELRDRAISSKDHKERTALCMQAIRHYMDEMSFATRPAQKNYLRCNIDKCLEMMGSSAMTAYQDSSTSTFSATRPYDKLDGIIGLETAKRTLLEDLKEFESIKDMPGIRRPKGIILYGPPGCGKTAIGRAIAGELGIDFYYVSCADILSKYYGESPRLIQELYRTARKSKSIIFIDEFEELASRKDGDAHEATRKIINQLLVELDGVEENGNVYTIGATNAPFSVEPALLRRLRPLYVQLPDEKSRERIISSLVKGHDVDAELVAHATESKTVGNVQYFFSADDIIELVGLASRIKWRRSRDKMKLATDDVMEALEEFTPSINEFDMKRYSELTDLMSQRKMSA